MCKTKCQLEKRSQGSSLSGALEACDIAKQRRCRQGLVAELEKQTRVAASSDSTQELEQRCRLFVLNFCNPPYAPFMLAAPSYPCPRHFAKLMSSVFRKFNTSLSKLFAV
ncbi:hypothetical protein TNCV_484271 [Trichonephila clavipes]|nr:hypothetical protein TNCV_484271 [Trichonephila clavipes]